MKWTSGAWYDGDWENGTQQGEGTFQDENGTVFAGQYENGNWIDPNAQVQQLLEDELPKLQVLEEEETVAEEKLDFCTMLQAILEDYPNNFERLKGEPVIEDFSEDLDDAFDRILAGDNGDGVKKNQDLSQRWSSIYNFQSGNKTFIYDGIKDYEDGSELEGSWTWKTQLFYSTDFEAAKEEYNSLCNVINVECKNDFVKLALMDGGPIETDKINYYSSVWGPDMDYYSIAAMIGAAPLNLDYKLIFIELSFSYWQPVLGNPSSSSIGFRCYTPLY